MVKLWDVVQRGLFATLDRHRDTVHSMAFSPDVRTLASAGQDAFIHLWDIDLNRVRKRLCDKLADGVTQARWRQFMPNLPARPICRPLTHRQQQIS